MYNTIQGPADPTAVAIVDYKQHVYNYRHIMLESNCVFFINVSCLQPFFIHVSYLIFKACI